MKCKQNDLEPYHRYYGGYTRSGEVNTFYSAQVLHKFTVIGRQYV